MSEQSEVCLPLAKTCLYVTWFVMSGHSYPYGAVLKHLKDGTVPEMGGQDSSTIMDYAKDVLNSIGQYAERYLKSPSSMRYGQSLVSLIDALSTKKGVPEEMLGLFISIFRISLNQMGLVQGKKRERDVPVYTPVTGVRDVVYSKWSFVADGTDMFGKAFRLYSLVEEDGKALHHYVLSVPDMIEDVLESHCPIRLRVERTDKRKGVLQCVSSLVKFLEIGYDKVSKSA